MMRESWPTSIDSLVTSSDLLVMQRPRLPTRIQHTFIRLRRRNGPSVAGDPCHTLAPDAPFGHWRNCQVRACQALAESRAVLQMREGRANRRSLVGGRLERFHQSAGL